MPRKGKREHVTFKSVRLALYPHGKSWRVAYPDESVKGGWRYITRSTKDDAKEAGHRKAVEIANGLLDLSNLPEDKARLARAFLDLKPTWETIERLRRESKLASISIGEAIEKFHAFKVMEKGQDTRHLRLMKADAQSLADTVGSDTPLAKINQGHIRDWLDDMDVGPKRRKDYRGAVVSLWRWACKQDLIEVRGSFTEPEKIPVPKIAQKEIRFFTPDEMVFLLKNVSDSYRAWLVLASFSGLRTGEIRSWTKRPLDWSMIRLKERVIIVPAEISKNRRRKLVPVGDTLAAWLESIGPKKSGPICHEPAYKQETGRLGRLLDIEFERSEGWPDNALRHSFATYRVAQSKSLSKVAHEMDNSEAMLRKHYVEAASEAEAEAYFSLVPSELYRTEKLTLC